MGNVRASQKDLPIGSDWNWGREYSKVSLSNGIGANLLDKKVERMRNLASEMSQGPRFLFGINKYSKYHWQRVVHCISFSGIVALIWVVVWQILASDSPENDNHISNVERRMILESLQAEHTSQKVRKHQTFFKFRLQFAKDIDSIMYQYENTLTF